MFREAAALGVLQVHLSGGEPGARRDLVEITAAARAAGLYTNLITSAVGITDKTLGALTEAGLDHVQISIQDSEAASADHIAGYDGAFARKRALAAEQVVRRGLPLTVNAVMHRANIDRIGDMVDLALALGASRVEIAHVQYYGWALKNRAMLMPTRAQVERAAVLVEELRARHHGRIVIDAVVPDYYARYPKPCVGGWGRRSLNVTPAGKGAAVSRRRIDYRPRVLERARSFARRDLGELARLQRLPRHRLDEGAVRELPAPRAGFRRLPLPGVRAHRRRRGDRSGVPSLARAWHGRGAGGHQRGDDLFLSADVTRTVVGPTPGKPHCTRLERIRH